MAFKKGVTGEDVDRWREYVKYVKDLDSYVDSGKLTPDEAISEHQKFSTKKSQVVTAPPTKKDKK